MVERNDVLKKARAHDYIAWWKAASCYVNLAGNYDYLEMPYYISQQLEADGQVVHPTCSEMLDAYVPPLFLEKAKLAGLHVPDFYISNGFFEPPVIIDPINPFMTKSRVVLKPGRERAIAKSMTRNFTYAICCQELPSDAEIRRFHSVLGWCTPVKYRELSQIIWNLFHLPLARVRLVEYADGKLLLSDISQLPLKKLGKREMEHLAGEVSWDE